MTIARAPSRTATWSAAIATPPPIPQMSTVSPAARRARVVSMRHAVSAASENAAGPVPRHSVRNAREILRRNDDVFGTVPLRCSPSTRKLTQSDSSPSRHAGALSARDARVEHDPIARAKARRHPCPRSRLPRPIGAEDVRELQRGPGSPFATKRSSRLRAAVWMRTIASPGPGWRAAGVPRRARSVLEAARFQSA